MTGPSSGDLYKTNPNLRGLGKKKKKKPRSASNNKTSIQLLHESREQLYIQLELGVVSM